MDIDAVLAVFPTKYNLETFLGWLRGLDIDKEEKRQLLIHWVDRVGIVVTGYMVKRAELER